MRGRSYQNTDICGPISIRKQVLPDLRRPPIQQGQVRMTLNFSRGTDGPPPLTNLEFTGSSLSHRSVCLHPRKTISFLPNPCAIIGGTFLIHFPRSLMYCRQYRPYTHGTVHSKRSIAPIRLHSLAIWIPNTVYFPYPHMISGTHGYYNRV